VQLNEGLKQLLQQPLMIILGTADPDLRPAIARAMGIVESKQEGHLEAVFSNWQWPETAVNIRETGRVALTIASPSKYTSYQMKGRAWVRAPTLAEIERSVAYMQAIEAELISLGVPPNLTGPWLCNRDPMLVTVDITEIYVQTPGPKAGMTAERLA
jgi:hypothetical protein